MSRPPKCRRVEFMPDVTYFKPAGIPLRDLDEVRMSVEEAEALRYGTMEELSKLTEAKAAKKLAGPTRPSMFVLNKLGNNVVHKKFHRQ